MSKEQKIHNAADPKTVEDADKKVKNERDQQLSDLRDLLATPQGERFFKRLFDEGGLFNTTFTGNSQTYFKEGWRALALKVLSDVCEAVSDPTKIGKLLIREKKD